MSNSILDKSQAFQNFKQVEEKILKLAKEDEEKNGPLIRYTNQVKLLEAKLEQMKQEGNIWEAKQAFENLFFLKNMKTICLTRKFQEDFAKHWGHEFGESL